jgi:hypothetical protein
MTNLEDFLRSKIDLELSKVKELELERNHFNAVSKELEDKYKNCCDDRLILTEQLKQAKATLDKIDCQTFHAGCMGNPSCNDCKIQNLIKQGKDNELLSKQTNRLADNPFTKLPYVIKTREVSID